MEPADKPPRNFIRQIIDDRLDTFTEQRIRQYTRDYAVDADGKTDDEMAFVIRREVLRRSTMGRELDIYEPFQWSLASFVLVSVGTIGLKFLMGDKVDKAVTQTILATTALGSAINLMRLESRFEAGLRGGLDTAFSMVDLEKIRREKQRETYKIID
jgi:hypothetical protein